MNQEQDPVQLAEIRCLAEQGNAEAQFSLGFRYDEGEGVPRDSQEAVKWWRKAAEQGHDQAQFNLGDMYARGDGVSEDKTEAMKWLRFAAEQGHAEAQFSLDAIRHDWT